MKKALQTVILFVLFALPMLAQNPTYEARLINDSLVNPTTYEFDVYFKRTGATPFETYGLQLALLFSDSIRNGGTLAAIYIPGTSEMLTAQIPNNPNITSVVNNKRVFKLAGKIPSGPGQGTLLSTTGNGTRLGRFRITVSGAAAFLGIQANLAWNFDQATWGYATKINAYVGGFPQDITVPAGHLNELINPILPVELTNFETSAEGRNITLIWETKTEVNSNKFEIERSIINEQIPSARSWNKIGDVSASGTSTTPREYSFVDNKLQSGKYAYRLKMIDNDGTFEFSKEVETEVDLPQSFAISQNYPNPFNPSTKIDYQLPFDSKVTLELYGITGEKVATILNGELSAGYYTTEVNAGALNLASGVYVYRISASAQNNQNFVQVKKLMLTK